MARRCVATLDCHRDACNSHDHVLRRRLSTAWQVEAVIVFANLSSLAVLYGDKKLFEENVRQPFADPSTPHQSPHHPSDQHHHSTSVRLRLRLRCVYPPTLHWASISEALQVTTKVVVSLVVIVAGALMFSQGDFNCTKARARASAHPLTFAHAHCLGLSHALLTGQCARSGCPGC